VTISEPAAVSLSNLFKQADVVAVVQVLSGDSENYETAVYKSKVLTPFKGTTRGEELYFGPTSASALATNMLRFFDVQRVARTYSPNQPRTLA